MVFSTAPKTRSVRVLLFAATIVVFCYTLRLFTVDVLPEPATPKVTAFGDNFDIDRYFRGQNGQLHLYRDTSYPSTPEIQRAIHKHQNPPDCSRARYLIHEPFTAFGLGAVYYGISKSLAIAHATNRVLVIQTITKPWPLSEGCDTPGHRCFFQPETRCTIPANATRAVFNNRGKSIDLALSGVQVVEIRSLTPYLRDINVNNFLSRTYANLGVAPPLSRAHKHRAWRRKCNERAWNTQAMLYLTRLNRRMQQLVRPIAKKCSENGAARGTLGVPLRGSDKCYEGNKAGEMDCLKPITVWEHMRRVRYTQPWLYRAIVTSEDDELEVRTKRLLRTEWEVFSLADTRPGTGRPNEQVNKTIAQYRYTEAALKVLVCQLTADAHVLTPKSNFHSMIDLLAKVVPGRHSHYAYAMGTLRIK